MDDLIDELWIKADGDKYWTVIGYDDLIEAINKIKTKFINKKGYETTN